MTHSPENDAPLTMQAYLEKLRHLPQGPPLSPFTPYPEVNEPERGACVTPPGQTAEKDARPDNPATLNCPLRCAVPAGVKLTEVPPPRHDWADVLRCPNDDCGKAFLHTADEAPA